MKPRTRAVLLGYAMLLVASGIARRVHRSDGAPDAGERILRVDAVDHDRVEHRPIRLALFDSAPGGMPASPPAIVLLHGSPGDNHEVLRLARALAGRYRVIAPDLPGFGGSSWWVPDYSIRAHARYVLQMLDSLGIRRAHLLGFSMGGGVALNVADIAPNRVASLTMLSAIGVQEFELLGDYSLNHAIHGLQLAGIWLGLNAIPHFGAWDGGMLGLPYARNFYDSDQRSLRGILQHFQGPMLIIQGKADPLVPAAIGPEHHRIVPQSELLLIEGDHFMAFQRPMMLADSVAAFLGRVETGAAATRATASPDRLRAAAEPFDPRTTPPAGGIAFAVLMLLLTAATLVSEDLTCIATGLLVARGTVGFLPGTIACFVGIVGGDFLLYAAGRFIGRPALRRRPLRWLLGEADLARTSAWFARKGPALVLSSRFVPGTRLPTYVAAGLLHTRFLPFAGFFLLAAALWTPLLVGFAMLFGETVLSAFGAYRRWSVPALITGGVALLVLVHLVLPLCSWRGRRLLLSRWRRLTRWEFWPPWVFYPPLVLYVLWLGIKHRSLTLFSAANPGIPGGGFAGESKWQILQGLQFPDGRLPRTALIHAGDPLDERVRRVEELLRLGASWPLVLKPDIGERGDGVALVKSTAEARCYLEQARDDVLAQEYVPGREFGVFYYRLPGEAEGRIFSITDKRLPSVTGDGRATLETLILRGDRTVSIARFLLGRHAARLWEVPGEGEVVPLVELGTHCRGAAFFDGTRLSTPALLRAVDQISGGFKDAGFWFGRYDVRTESAEALQAGRFRIIELNGATSEATSIYDPEHGLLDAYRTLREQWRILFEIGARNRASGVEPATLGELLTLLRRHQAAKRAHAIV